MAIVEFRLGDGVELRKPHPCGGRAWTVVRLGTDIGLSCDTCGQRLLLSRSRLERRLRRVVRGSAEAAGAPPDASDG